MPEATIPVSNVVDLSLYKNPAWHDKGRGFLVRAIWHVINAIFIQNQLNPSSAVKKQMLKMFGAKIGKGVILKPGINVKSPWLLEIGDNTWIGENVWLDTFFPIKIGSNVCISQGVYLCTGNHDWTDPAFGLIDGSLVIEDGAWVGAGALILPGAHVASHTVVAGGAVLSKTTEPYMIYSGNPAVPVKKRIIKPRDAFDKVSYEKV